MFVFEFICDVYLTTMKWYDVWEPYKRHFNCTARTCLSQKNRDLRYTRTLLTLAS